MTEDTGGDGDQASRVGTSIGSILVATDGSEVAGRALERAMTIAEGTGATVHVLAVVDTVGSPMTFDVDTVSELEAGKERVVEEIVAAHDDHVVDMTGAVRRGRPAAEILAYGDDHDVDFVVVGRSGQSRIADRLLGSTADRVVRTASRPVVVVPEEVLEDE